MNSNTVLQYRNTTGRKVQRGGGFGGATSWRFWGHNQLLKKVLVGERNSQQRYRERKMGQYCSRKNAKVGLFLRGKKKCKSCEPNNHTTEKTLLDGFGGIDEESSIKGKTVNNVKWLTMVRAGFAFLLVFVGVGMGLWMFLMINSWNDRFQANAFKLELELLSLNLDLTLQSYKLETAMLGQAVKAVPSLSKPAFQMIVSPFTEHDYVRGVSMVEKIHDEDRKAVEKDIAEYNLVTGKNKTYNFKAPGSFEILPRKNDYWVITKVDPVDRNNMVDSLGLDLSDQRKAQLAYMNATGQPALFGPRKLRIESNSKVFSILLMMPIDATRFIQTVLDGDMLIRRSLRKQVAHMRVYLFVSEDGEPMSFAGGLDCSEHEAGAESSNYQFCRKRELLDVATLEDVRAAPGIRFSGERVVEFANRELLLVVQAYDNFGLLVTPSAFVVTAFVSTLVLFTLLAILYLANLRQQIQFTKRLSNYEILRVKNEAVAVCHAERFLNEFLAHEVRNPLSVAICAVEFLQNAIQSESSNNHNTLNIAVATQDLCLLKESLSYMNELVSNMLDLNKFSSQKITLKAQPINVLDDLFIPIQSMLQRANNDRVAIEVNCPPDVWIRADALRLKQVFMNLAKNSIKFVSEGYVRLVLHEMENEEDGKEEGLRLLEFRVEDSGPGVPAEKQHLLFQKYCSMDNRNQATGIGLSLCQVLVSAMNGSISLDPTYVSTVPGQPGACFRVSLPCEAISDGELDILSADGVELGMPQDSRTCGEGSVVSVYSDGISVLIVDDEAPIRLMLRRKLERIFPEITCMDVASGEAALELIEGNPDRFDVIFQDHYMDHVSGGMNGEDAIAKYLECGCSAMIVGCSANDLEERYLKAGACAFFRKPLPKDNVLVTTLTKALQFPRGLRFLIVDDEKTNCSILKRKLEAIVPQSHIECVSKPEEAFDLVTKMYFNFAMLDGHFENTSFVGSQAAEYMRELDAVDALVSISGDPDMSSSALFDTVWGKPYPSSPKMRLDLLKLLQVIKHRKRDRKGQDVVIDMCSPSK